MVIFKGECLNNNKPFDVGAGSNYDSNTGILTEFLPLQDRVNCAGSGALVEVCGLRVLLVFTSANEVMFSSTVVCQQDYAKRVTHGPQKKPRGYGGR